MVESLAPILVPAAGGVLLLVAVACRISNQCRRMAAHARIVHEANRITEHRRRRLVGEDADIDLVDPRSESDRSI